MFNAIRPEVVAALRRYAQTLVGVGVALFGLWIVSVTFGFVIWFGYAVIAIGIALIVEGLRRARFAASATGDGPGIVEIDERRISWMSAHFGGAVEMDLLQTVEILVSEGGKPMWIFTQSDGQRLAVPAAAQGAEGIIDALSALHGLDFSAALKVLSSDSQQRVVLWRAPHTQNISTVDDPLT